MLITKSIQQLFISGVKNLNDGNLNGAKEIFEKIIQLHPKNYDALNTLGIISAQLSLYEKALYYFSKAIKISPENKFFYCNRGNVYIEMNQLEYAEINFKKAIHIDSNYAEAYSYLAVTLVKKGLYSEATEKLKKSIQIKPNYADAHLNLGNIYFEIKEYDNAINSYVKAIESNPELAIAYSNLGNSLKKIDKNEEAIENYNKAIDKNPNLAVAYFNRGNLMEELQLKEDALKDYDYAIKKNDSYAEAYWNRSLLLLSLGRFTEGWADYDWRWKYKELNIIRFQSENPKLTNLQTVKNQKLLIIGEQGLGDQILFSSLLNELNEISSFIQVVIDRKLIVLFERSMPKIIFIPKENMNNKIKYDFYMPIVDLGKFFRSKSQDFQKTKNNYLIADDKKALQYKTSFLNNKKFLCGITWKSKNEKFGKEKSIALSDLHGVLSFEEISYVSLQYGDCTEEIKKFNTQFKLNLQECTSIDHFNDIDSHAALIEACDFVITVSNTTTHISGAIGKETLLLSSVGKGSLWYWSNEINGSSLWYPNTKIIKQIKKNSWSDVIDEVIKLLKHKINAIK